MSDKSLPSIQIAEIYCCIPTKYPIELSNQEKACNEKKKKAQRLRLGV